MFILKKGHRPGVYVPLRALFLVFICFSVFVVDVCFGPFCFLAAVMIAAILIVVHCTHFIQS